LNNGIYRAHLRRISKKRQASWQASIRGVYRVGRIGLHGWIGMGVCACVEPICIALGHLFSYTSVNNITSTAVKICPSHIRKFWNGLAIEKEAGMTVRELRHNKSYMVISPQCPNLIKYLFFFIFFLNSISPQSHE